MHSALYLFILNLNSCEKSTENARESELGVRLESVKVGA